MIKKTLKYTAFTVLGFIGFFALYFLAAVLFSRWQVKKELAALTQEEMPFDIYILSNGVHTDIVVPVKNDCCDWSLTIPFSNTVANDTNAQWLAFGWGDKGFYLETPTWADLKFSTAFKATFGLSAAAMHTTFYNRMLPGENCKAISIYPSQYKILEKAIKTSFVLEENERPIHIKTNANYGKTDAFYEARGSYSLFTTCNTWANSVLKNAGLKACFWTPFDKGIFYHYR
jgi:uncharacterized protein (TIGR02117 family)